MALGSTQPVTEIGVFSGGEDGRCLRLATLPPSWAVVMKSGNLNYVEPSGPLQACNGTALPLPLPLLVSSKHQTSFHWSSHILKQLEKLLNLELLWNAKSKFETVYPLE
jgi:hypothetical protein